MICVHQETTSSSLSIYESFRYCNGDEVLKSTRYQNQLTKHERQFIRRN